MTTQAWSPASTLAMIITFAASGVLASTLDLAHVEDILEKSVESRTCEEISAFIQQHVHTFFQTSISATSAHDHDGTAGVEVHAHDQLKEGLDNCTETKEIIRKIALQANVGSGQDLTISATEVPVPCLLCESSHCAPPSHGFCESCCDTNTYLPTCFVCYY